MDKQERLRIGCDLDGVLYDFSGVCRFLLEEEFGIKIPKDWASFGWPIEYLKSIGKSEAWRWLWKPSGGIGRGLFRHGNVLKGGAKATHMLDKYGDVVLVTSRPKLAAADTFLWIGLHNLKTTEVHILGSGVSKADTNCDVYIDDSDDNIEEIQAAGKIGIIWDQSWNWQYDKANYRAKSWEEVEKIISSIYNERVNDGYRDKS